ncbi:type II and III secretion system protein [Synechococcus sp. WH 8016]|nr:type II and III secretion system protein [Synechococcus sp. WH 8016]
MGIPSRASRLIPLALIGSLALAECDVVFGLGGAGAIRAQSQGSMNLRLRRGSQGVELVIEGVGAQPQLQQRMNGQAWEGSLRTQGEPGVRNGQVRLTDPATGIQSATLVGSGSSYALKVTPSPGQPLQDPVVSANGRDLILKFPGLVVAPTLQTGRLNLNTPGRVPQTQYAPPLRPRAVAPPLGDMAVGTMVMQNRSYVNVSGPPVTLMLNNAPAKDALMALARLGGYGFVYVGGESGGATQQVSTGQQQTAKRLVSLAFLNEEFGRAFNSVLLASGLKGRLSGNSLFVGKTVVGASFSPQVSKVYRLNQISADSAAQYLASLGASVCTPTTTTFNSSNSATQGTASSTTEQSETTSSEKTEISCYGGGRKEGNSMSGDGPLFGLEGTTDKRLSTVTLVGESRQIAIAEKYLKNLDLRKRQVAVKVQILNVDLKNDRSVDSSFSARIGNTFMVSESGKAFMNFGDYRPGNSSGTGVLGRGSAIAEPGVYETALADDSDAFVPQQRVVSPFVQKLDRAEEAFDKDGNFIGIREIPFINSDKQREYVPDTNPNAADQLVPVYDNLGRPVYVPSSNPADNPKDNGFSYPKNSFYGYLEAMIQSSSAKTLASPTLLVQEGESASVETGTSVITGVDSTETANGSTQFQNTRENAGLTLDVVVSKIDDNGFVTLNLVPSVSVPQPAGTQQGVPIFNIISRKLNSGSVRLRDRQTLVLTGVIQDSDRETVRKWPILGDLPFIGQMFRSSDNQREKQELVILVTPSIIDDEAGGAYGYGYRPSTRESRELMGQG